MFVLKDKNGNFRDCTVMCTERNGVLQIEFYTIDDGEKEKFEIHCDNPTPLAWMRESFILNSAMDIEELSWK